MSDPNNNTTINTNTNTNNSGATLLASAGNPDNPTPGCSNNTLKMGGHGDGPPAAAIPPPVAYAVPPAESVPPVGTIHLPEFPGKSIQPGTGKIVQPDTQHHIFGDGPFPEKAAPHIEEFHARCDEINNHGKNPSIDGKNPSVADNTAKMQVATSLVNMGSNPPHNHDTNNQNVPHAPGCYNPHGFSDASIAGLTHEQKIMWGILLPNGSPFPSMQPNGENTNQHLPDDSDDFTNVMDPASSYDFSDYFLVVPPEQAWRNHCASCRHL
jgi:hypothetical protein